jgi:hypothetical protein
MKKFNLRFLIKPVTMVSALGLLAIGALLPATVFAASSQQAKCGATDLKCVITAGDVLIGNRQNSLNTLKSKISTDLSEHKLTSDQASALQADVATNQTGLSNLKSKLDAETDVKAARQDIANIFLQFRIYAVVLPRDYRRIQFDIEINAKNLMQGFASKIKDALSSAPANEQTQLNALFSDYQKQVAAAESQLDSAQQDFPALTPENFNQNRLSYESTRTALNTALEAARTDLHQAAQDLKQMAHILGIKKSS